jgi:hypothetical protein
MFTRSKGPAAAAAADDDEQQQQPRRGKAGRTVAEAEESDLARGRTRGGKLFTRQSRGHYATLTQLRKAHPKLFSLEPSFYLVEVSVDILVCVHRLSTNR